MLTRLRDRDDAGITLAELVVSMTLLTILLAIGGTFFVTAIRSTNATTLTNQQTADARLTLDSWTAKLRVAAWLDSAQTDRFEVVTSNKIVFYANLNNRATTDFTVGPVSKVVLMLKTTNAATGDGQLIEIVFQGNTTTPTYVRRVALNARAIGGAGNPIFTPYNYAGGEINPASYNGCIANGVVKPGLCLSTLPAGAGMADPTVGLTDNTVTSGALTANPAYNPTDHGSDFTLQSIVAVKIGFTVSDTADTVNQDYESMAAVNSGYGS
jgi:type II secretory pathway pseudopilin PulG